MNETLQHLCAKRISSDLGRFVVDADLFTYTTLQGMQLLLKPSSDVKAKLSAIGTWIESSKTDRERMKREGHFNELIECLDLRSLPNSFIAGIAIGKSGINITENCK